MVAVEGIAHPGEVVILAVGGEHIVDVVVQALEGKEGALLVALGGVVDHHVQNNLNAVLVEGADQMLELGTLMVEFRGGGVAGVGGKEADGVVAPVVEQLPAVHDALVRHLVKLKNGHQLHRVDPQLQQIGQLFQQALKGAGVLDTGGGMLGKAPDVGFINDHVPEGEMGVMKGPPVEDVLHHPGVIGEAGSLVAAPYALSRDRPGVGVQQVLGLVEEQAPVRVVRTVHPVGVLDLVDVQVKDDHGEGVADTEVIGKGQDGKGLLLGAAEEAQLAVGGVDGVDGEADPAGHHVGAVEEKEAGPHPEAGDGVGGGQRFGGQQGGGLWDHGKVSFEKAGRCIGMQRPGFYLA